MDNMDLKEYFKSKHGKGVLATADANGKVDAAIYSIPHFEDDNTVSFIMRERLTHKNLQSNPYAIYLFMEDVPHYKGVRIFLEKIREEKDTPRIEELMKRHLSEEEDKALGPKYLVNFAVEEVLPLIGGS